MNEITIKLAENGYVVREDSSATIETRVWVFGNTSELSDWIAERYYPKHKEDKDE